MIVDKKTSGVKTECSDVRSWLTTDSPAMSPVRPLCLEVSLGPAKAVEVDKIAPKTIDFLCDLRILESRRDIIWKSHVDVHFGYPVYTHERPSIVAPGRDEVSVHD